MLKTPYLSKFRMLKYSFSLLLFILLHLHSACAQHKPWLQFKPQAGTSNGKKVLLISGDEEYRSEESMPMMAKLLAKHGFETYVLFAIDPKTKQVNPEYQTNIPGLALLNSADLMIIATRFRALPDEQMSYIDRYLKAGKPVIGLRTATHAFNYGKDVQSAYKHYSFNEKEGPWKGGFGGLVLGETWINHHGDHGKEGTRAFINGLQVNVDNPILRGVKDIWVPSDVYGIKNTLSDANILVFGQPTSGMTASSPVNWQKTLMPIAWTREYQLPEGRKGKVFTSTMGSSVDLQSADLRRLILNASLWAVGLENSISADLDVSPVGNYTPKMFGFGTYDKGKYPEDFQ